MIPRVDVVSEEPIGRGVTFIVRATCGPDGRLACVAPPVCTGETSFWCPWA